jgi:hypothetical protein
LRVVYYGIESKTKQIAVTGAMYWRIKFMNEVIETLQKWQVEAVSKHNDGYIQKHYQDKIDEVVSYLVKTQLEDKEHDWTY